MLQLRGRVTKSWALRLSISASALAIASASASAQTVQLDGIVLTFSKMAESAIEALSGSSAIDKDQLDQQFQPDSVSQFINTIPGVSSTQSGASDPAQSINIRGLQDFGRVNVLVEGARQNFARSGHGANGAFYFEPEMLKRVDVTRGPTSTIYGSGAIGGVVAFELLDADDILMPGEYAAVRTRTRYGTNGNSKLGSATGAVRVGNFDVLGQLNGRWSDDYEDGAGVTISDTGDTTKSGLVKARWELAPGHKLAGTFIDYRSDFVDNVDGAERDTALENQQYTLGYTFSRPDIPLVDFSAKAYKNTTNLKQIRLNGSQYDPAGSRRSFEVETTGFDVFNTSRFDFGNTKVAFTYGGDAFEDQVVTSGYGTELTPSGRRTASGAFAQGKVTFFDTLDIIAALRYDHYELKGGDVHSEGERVSPKITAGLTPFNGVTFFATYAEGYRAPAITETLIQGTHSPPATFPLLPNPNLRPEVAHNVEGGINLAFDGLLRPNDAFRAKFVAFQNKVDDYIDMEDVADADPVQICFPALCIDYYPQQYQNIANATIEGIEFEAMYDARSWFIGIGAHRIRGENDDTGEPLETIPADQITLTVGMRAFNEKLVAGARTRFVAAQDRVSTASLATSGYTVVDLFGEYQLNDNATINVNIDNLFDKEYRQYLDLENSPGFSARVGLTMRLGVQ
jgi:TonB-dependent heme/hemoglobin receptor family protein/TonB-dependent hemoglobin/transferrin/lactoferrin receptor family protein